MKYKNSNMLCRILLIPFLLIFSLSASAKITSMGQAIDDAGRQRMLTQRMLKNYNLIGLNVKADEARAELTAAITLFDKQLTDLKNYHVNNRLTEQLNKITQLWGPYKKSISGTPAKETALELRKSADELLAACNEAVLLLQEASGKQSGRLVNIAGRQRMLSQRMANLYLFRAWGINDVRVDNNFSQAMNEFKGALEEMRGSDINTPEITQGLRKVKIKYGMFVSAMNSDSGEFIPSTINKAAEGILKKMNEITKLYAKLL